MRFITNAKFDALSRGKTQDQDMVITVRGTIGHVAIYNAIEIGYKRAFINAQMMIIRPTSIPTSFLYYITRSGYWQEQLYVGSYGTAQQQLSNELLANMYIVLPSSDEVASIEAFLLSALATIDALLAAATRAIDLLQERRTALISAAVTGKIDVRGLAGTEAA
jgi:type I restriction enzyme S subunit